ncbi:DUF7620 family protein [Nonomuraea bangladeshensis]|uniref:DUF7620 family protein n=1 Tax=Nonomuraea bangladeshensis TaxID=404385 RepID=UPI003C305460
MTRPEDQPDIQQAAREVEQSKLQAQRELDAARKRARHALRIAQRLRELREANGFYQILDDAFGGGGRG